MKGPLYIEVLDRHGEVRQRQRVEMLPVRIGRAYDNDVILDDRQASLHHAVVEHAPDGGMLVRDIEGGGVMHKGRRSSELALDGDTVFRIGNAQLRVRSADFSPVAENVDRGNWEGWRPALTGIVMIVLLMWWSNWATDTDESMPIHYFISITTFVLFAMAWCGVWALANRLFSGQTRFGRHVFIVACGLVGTELLALVMGTLGYAFSWELFPRYGNHATVWMVGAMVYFHLATVSPVHKQRIAVTCVLLSLLGSTIMLMVHYQGKGYLADELYMGELMPPHLRVSSDKPIAGFLDDARQLRTRVDSERIKIITNAGNDGDDDAGDN